MNNTFILDTSVIAKWFFPEIDNDKALTIKDQFSRSDISIVIPILLYYEMNNLFRTAVKRFRIDAGEAVQAYTALLQLEFISYSTEFLLKKTLECALKYDISSYDAAYIALAEYLEIPFITADNKLLNKIKSKLIIDLKDYKN